MVANCPLLGQARPASNAFKRGDRIATSLGQILTTKQHVAIDARFKADLRSQTTASDSLPSALRIARLTSAPWP